jgi:hypothetical protein
MASIDRPDYLVVALTLTRELFVARHPFPFLFGEPPAPKVAGSRHRTLVQPVDELVGAGLGLGLGTGAVAEPVEPTQTGDWANALDRTPTPRPAGRAAPLKPLVVAIRKMQIDFPSMITVGRTANNDVVLDDSSISKFHAYFRGKGDSLELVDAGSKNGTWVGEERLEPKGAPRLVHRGDGVRFADLRLRLVQAEDLWSLVRTPA